MNVFRNAFCSCLVASVASLSPGLLEAAGPRPADSRLGMNLSGLVDWNTEHPFVDVFRLSRRWISQKEGAPWGHGPELSRDVRGWVTTLEPGCRAETPVLTGGGAPKGVYTCLYDGEGDIGFNQNSRVVQQSPGRVLVEIDGTRDGTFLSLRRTNPTNYVRNIRLFMPGFAEAPPAGGFHPAFLERWAAFNTFRFMDWQDTNNSEQRDWAGRPKPDDCNYTEKGAPVEVMVRLCNELKINPWFCLPHQATDDYVRQFATLVKRDLDPGLRVYVEYSNEVWNGMFGQHRYAQERARDLSLGPAERPWEGAAHFYARRATEIFRIWESAFGGRQRLVRVIAWQAAGGAYWSDNMVLGFEDTAAQCDALAIAPYISMNIGPATKPPAATVARWSVDQVLDYVETNSLPECLGWIATQKKVADKYRLKLLCYEAGQHLVGVGGGENNEALTRVFHDANRHARMGRVYTRYLEGWREAGGDLCCLFSSTSRWSKWGSWGLIERADQDVADIPKAAAVMRWNLQRP